MSDALEVHAERVPGDAATLRWVLPRQVPADGGPALRRLIDDGVLAGVVVERGSVLTVLARGRRWREAGTTVRDAIRASLTDPDGTAATVAHDDDALRAAVLAVLAGPAGSYVGSHGGRAELVDVADGVVTLRLGGACTHCPAAGVTLDRTLEREIRARYPGLVQVRRAPPPAGSRVRRSLGWLSNS